MRKQSRKQRKQRQRTVAVKPKEPEAVALNGNTPHQQKADEGRFDLTAALKPHLEDISAYFASEDDLAYTSTEFMLALAMLQCQQNEEIRKALRIIEASLSSLDTEPETAQTGLPR